MYARVAPRLHRRVRVPCRPAGPVWLRVRPAGEGGVRGGGGRVRAGGRPRRDEGRQAGAAAGGLRARHGRPARHRPRDGQPRRRLLEARLQVWGGGGQTYCLQCAVPTSLAEY